MPLAPLIKFKEEKKKPTWEVYQIFWADKNHNELLPILSWDDDNKKKQKEELTWNINQSALNNQNGKENETTNPVMHAELFYLMKECGMTFLGVKECAMKCGISINNAWKQALQQLEEYPHDKDKLWRMASVKTEGLTTSELLKIKNNPLSLLKPKYIQTFDIFGNIENDPKKFYEHYQQLALTRKEQEQCLEEINI
ncbi:hypothetical protein G9A89_011583 [Geosiphon pyriformis]|nr:hypothetical protein G9A89_011583 [Geosiphon pyriformis]